MPLWESLQNLPWFDQPYIDLPIYVFSCVGLLTVPPALGRWAWALPGWFLALNLFLLAAPHDLQPRENPVVYLAFSQLPGILFLADLLAAGKISGWVARIPLRDWLSWSLFRFMGGYFILVLFQQDLPPTFALTTAMGELFTALGALLLWMVYRPQQMWYRGLLLFWNAYGITAAMSTGIRMALANPELPFMRLPHVIHQAGMGFPQAWIPFYWIPVSLIIHLSVFYKMYLEWNTVPAPVPAVPEETSP